MTGPNSINSWEEIEENEKSQRNQADLYNKLINGFTKDYVIHDSNKTEDEKQKLIERIMSQDSIIGTEIEKDLQKYMAGKDEFTWLDLSKVNIFQLRNKLAWVFAVRKNYETKIKEKIIKDYDISSTDMAIVESTLADAKEVKESRLRQLVKGESAVKEFLEQYLSVLPNVREFTSILTKIDEKESARRISLLGKDDQQNVKVVLDRVHFDNKLNDADIQILRATWYLSEKELEDLVRHFIPHMTLQQAIDLEFVTISEALQKREIIISQQLAAHNIKMNPGDDQVKTLMSSLAFSEIIVSTSDYIKTPEDTKKVAIGIWFRQFAEDLAKSNEQIKQQLRKSGPASFDALREGIVGLDIPQLKGFKKFRKDSILEFSVRRHGEVSKQYIRIIDFDDENRSFSFKKVGADKINLSANSEAENIDYNTFYENLKRWKDSISVYTLWDIEEKVNSWEILKSSYQSYDESDFIWENGEKLLEKTRERYEEQLEQEISGLESDISKYPDSTLYKARCDQKKQELEELRDNWIPLSLVAEKANVFQILDKLDSLDPEGKDQGLEKGNFIETKENAFQIADIDIANETIYLNGLWNNREILSFAQFLEAFKKQKAKRAKKVSNFTELIDRVSSDLEWWNYKFESWKFKWEKIEHGGKIEDREIEFMHGKESDTLVKIVNITDGFVEIQRWEIKDTKDKKWNEWHDLHITGVEIETYTLNEFARFIESEKLVPDWKLWKKWLEIYPEWYQNKRTWSHTFGWAMWSIFVWGRMSFSELMAWGKMIPELAEEYFKKWGDIKAAKAAYAMGKFLPQQMRDELLVKIERAESESMEKALEDLGKIDSPIAVKRIEWWLLDKNTPEYNKEAGMLFMLQKYGHLTSKGPMYPYRWKFLWYEAMWGRVNDALYLRIKNELEEDGQNFSEEFLMWMLMKEQCKWGHYSWIKRRWRIHKEFEWKFKAGMEEEFEKWHKDASTKRTAAKMVKEGMGEALWGTTTNALGWMKKAVERWGSLEDMMEISFSLLFSGAVFDMDQASYLRAKSLWDWDGQPVISQRMMSSKSEMQLFNDTVLELSKVMQDAYPQKYPNMASEAEKIFENISKRGEIPEKDRLETANKFWHKYGKPLSRALNFSMQDDSEFSQTDTIIKRKKSKNPVFKRYYEKASWYVWEGNYFKEEFVDDWAGETGIYGLNTFKMAEKFLAMDQWGALKKWSPAKKYGLKCMVI